ncbi:MAG TPA: alpha/beta hydrolase [Solirubrobacteraceae bacterium]|nr:alpha/beta hydrolase [Solirubrobacteraceae bacterium]
MAGRHLIAGPRGQLEVEVTGPDDGATLIFHMGTPSAGSMYAPLVELGAERGLRHVVYLRPGYGDSERCPGRAVADCAADTAAVADWLEVERFYTAGRSGGGPHALACAALLPDRVIAAATIAGVAPADADGLDWLAGMGQENIDEFAAMRAGEAELLAFIEPFREKLISADPEEMHHEFGDLLSGVDRSVMTGQFAEYEAESTRIGMKHGVWGWFDDDLELLHDWGFELSDISRPVTIWQGAQDRMVPIAHGEWLAAHVPGARARLLPDHGHLSLALGHYGEVLDDLIAAGSST